MTVRHRLFASGLSAFFAASAAGLITGCAVPPTATTPNSATPPAQTGTPADTEPQNADA